MEIFKYSDGITNKMGSEALSLGVGDSLLVTGINCDEGFRVLPPVFQRSFGQSGRHYSFRPNCDVGTCTVTRVD